MELYEVTLTGTSAMLMHHDNIPHADYMQEWQNDPVNKGLSKAGDDRTPSWRWLGNAYHDGKHVAMPQENIMSCIMQGGALVRTGKGIKTFKAQTQSGLSSKTLFWDLFTAYGTQVSWPELEALTDVPNFSDHVKTVQEMGFNLFVKRAKVNKSKHIRVRPLFPTGWVVKGALEVTDEQITEVILLQILRYAGDYKGLGDWRPGGPTPGPYGTFTAEVKLIK